MGGIINAIWVLAATGAMCAIMLILASKYMKVEVDKKFEQVRACLPGANCGACGYAGCDGYAAALCDGTDNKTNRCVPGADSASRSISDVLGVEFQEAVERVAVIRCRGNCESVADKADYHGILSCAAVKLTFGGNRACSFGCMGYGDCAKACPENAIMIRDRLAHVNARLCVGCGLCVKACPNGVISLVTDPEVMLVACSSRDKGAATRKACYKGCIGCHRCEKECPGGAIMVTGNLAHIDHEKCSVCGQCAEVCPVGCILRESMMCKE